MTKPRPIGSEFCYSVTDINNNNVECGDRTMFKKMLLVSIIMASSSTLALAATPYVGGSLGATDLGIHKGGKAQAGAIGKLFGGYGSTYGVNENIYFGSELNIDVGNYPSDNGTTYGIGASFLPGFMITQYTMIYGRAGIEVNQNSHSSSTSLGSQFGLGLQTSLATNWDIRGEYVRLFNIDNKMNGKSQLNLGLVYKFN